MNKKNAELKVNELNNIMLDSNLPYRFEVRSYYNNYKVSLKEEGEREEDV